MAGPTSWFLGREPGPLTRLRLFCFPYAGGGASVFRAWTALLPRDVEVVPIQMPGHETRLNEPLFSNFQPLVDALARDLDRWLDVPFAFFGHSMGAVIAFELARRLHASGRGDPVHLFLAGRRAPHLASDEEPLHDLPDAELLERVRALNGTPATVLEDRELIELLLPILRADFAICESYEYRAQGPRLQCPLSVFGGTEDPEVSRDDLLAWREHTQGRFRARLFPGDHFFLHTARAPLLAAIADELPRG
jgi:medium-chain acyl-[acyl-carrier-protein] hydrolase